MSPTKPLDDRRSYRERQHAKDRAETRRVEGSARLKPGPPPKDPALKLSERVTMLLTPVEREALDRAAHDADVNVNEYLRGLVITKLVLDDYVK